MQNLLSKLLKKPNAFEKFIKSSSLFKANYVLKNEDVESLISLFTDSKSKNIEVFFNYLDDPK
jgi:pantoate kinase